MVYTSEAGYCNMLSFVLPAHELPYLDELLHFLICVSMLFSTELAPSHGNASDFSCGVSSLDPLPSAVESAFTKSHWL